MEIKKKGGNYIEILKSMISTLQSMSIVLATIAFIVIMIKIVVEPDNKHRDIKILKNVLIAFVLVVVTLSIIEMPQYYYGNDVSIVDGGMAEMTFADIVDKDCQGRETVNVDGKWYVVTDKDKTLGAMSGGAELETVGNAGMYNVTISGISVLRKYSECQGFFKGYFAEIHYYRDSDGFVFPASMTYNEYMESKGLYLNMDNLS